MYSRRLLERDGLINKGRQTTIVRVACLCDMNAVINHNCLCVFATAGNKELETVKRLWEKQLRTIQESQPSHSATKVEHSTTKPNHSKTKVDHSGTKLDHSETKANHSRTKVTKTDHSATKVTKKDYSGTKKDQKNGTKKVPSPSTARGPTTTRGQVNTRGKTTTTKVSSSSRAKTKGTTSGKSRGHEINSPPGRSRVPASAATLSASGERVKDSAERVTPQIHNRTSAIEGLLRAREREGEGEGEREQESLLTPSLTTYYKVG